METKKYYKYIISLLVFCLGGCSENFLERSPLDNLTVSQFYQAESDLLAATAPLYGLVWFSYMDKGSLSIGEGMSGNLMTDAYDQFFYFSAVSDGSGDDLIPEIWSSLYNIIQHSNFVINNIRDNSSASIPETAKRAAIGEVRFFRGLAYSYLIKIWGEGVPIVENPEGLVNDPLLKRIHPDDVYTYLLKDIRYAKDNLPESWSSSELGRVTKWSAEAYLAKMFLHYAGFDQVSTRDQTMLDSAKYYAADVIKNSGAALMGSYEDLFKRENNNNTETLIALQWNDKYGATWGAQNSRQAYMAAEGKITGAGDGWGINTGVSGDLLKLFEPDLGIDLRRKAIFMMNGDHYPELLKSQGGYSYTKDDICCIKKYVIGTSDDNDGHVSFMATDVCTYIMRLAELYLIYAEAILGNNASTNDTEALKYFNEIRKRANLPNKTSITFKDIFDEKRKEFAQEDLLWFEYVRWFYFEPDAVISELSKQDRGMNGQYTVEYNAGNYTITYRGDPVYYTPTAETMFLPYPEPELVQNPDLLDEPEHFDFNE